MTVPEEPPRGLTWQTQLSSEHTFIKVIDVDEKFAIRLLGTFMAGYPFGIR